MMERRGFLQAGMVLAIAPIVELDARASAAPAGFDMKRIAGPLPGKRINVIRAIRRSRPTQPSPVLYVHGGTFAAGLAVGWRFDGRSWMDDLADAGFDVWGFDFLGFGGSDRYDEMAQPAAASKALGRTPLACRQIDTVARHILAVTGARRVHLVAHSWGTQPAAKFAGDAPGLVDRLVLFGAILERQPGIAVVADPDTLPGYTTITVDAQWKRFTEDVPKDHPPVLLERHFKPWSAAYLDTDPASRNRTPPAVQTPLGPVADFAAAWRGHLSYDPGAVKAPTMLVRGEWDSLCDDRDAAWFMHRFTNAAGKRDVKIPAGTHLAHLEESRIDLWRTTREFLIDAL
ncbi:MAG TPA: alpha/beta fold hydrolase [Burkholderiaceae bacterium]|nr:alpha/beta fold hydrolase [Burkholderiaceae bacterium]